MMSGARPITASCVVIRSLADLRAASSGKMSTPPAMAISSETQEIAPGALSCADERAERADHVKNVGNRALIEGMHGDACPDEFRDDLGLQVGKRKDEVWFEGEDFGDVGGDEC
jgi:hypothetical protein